MAINALGLDDLVSAMPHAAAVLDRSARVVVGNRQWDEMAPLLARIFPTDSVPNPPVVDPAGAAAGDDVRAGLIAEPVHIGPDGVLIDLTDGPGIGHLAGARIAEDQTDPVLAFIDHRRAPAEGLHAVVAGRATEAVERFTIAGGFATDPETSTAATSYDVRVTSIGEGTQYVLATCQPAPTAAAARSPIAQRHPLTGLPGRDLFAELLAHAMGMSDRYRYRPAVLVIGFAGLAMVDAECGVGARDELIVSVAARLQAGLRPGDVVAQIGDERFAVLLPDVDGVYLAEAVAARLASEVTRPFKLRGGQVEIALTIGVAIADRTKGADAVVEAAGFAFEEALAAGEHIVTATGFGDNPDDPPARPAKTDSAARRIDVADLREEELITYFQPVFDLTDQRVVAGEALMRWRHPHYGVLSAGEFLGLALNAGLLGALTDQALVTAAETWADLRDDLGAVPPRLFVNLSPEQLLSRVAVDRLYHLLIATGIPSSEVVVEVTEEAMSTRFDEMLSVLGEIRAQGLRIAIDDFGSGYSSLGRLRHLPVDVLKVDQSLVRGLETDHRARQVLAAVSTIAVELDVECIVEGIETAAEAGIVADLGFRFVQGYHFARPMPAAEFAAVAHPLAGAR